MELKEDKKDKKTFCLGLRPASSLPWRLYANEFASIRHDINDGTTCWQNSIKSPPLRSGEKTHFVLNKKPSGREILSEEW